MKANGTIFPRFRDITPAALDCDLHIHTTATDGKAAAAEILSRAEEIGLKKVAFTEHVRADSEWFREFANEARGLTRPAKITVLIGAEARITDTKGSLDITEAIRRECDLVLGSVHRFPDSKGGLLPFSKIPAVEFAQREFELALGFIKNGQGDVLAHPGGMSAKFGHIFPADLLRQLMREAASHGKVIEINSMHTADMRDFCAIAAEENPLISIGSDVHALEDLGQCRARLKEFLWND